jgi:hypothetical protein
MSAIRPLRRVRRGVARSRDERFELVRGEGCWQARSLTAAGALDLQGGACRPPVAYAATSPTGSSGSRWAERDTVTISLDELSRLTGERYRREDRERGRTDADPHKLTTEPGRARPGHDRPTTSSRRLAVNASLGGAHS